VLLRSWVRLPMGANFKVRIKKIPSFVLRQSTGLRSSPGRGRCVCPTLSLSHIHMGYGAAVYEWGRGLEVFLTCVRSS
jgi:hypothetical protein